MYQRTVYKKLSDSFPFRAQLLIFCGDGCGRHGCCGLTLIALEVEHVDHDDGRVSDAHVQRVEQAANFFLPAINKYGQINSRYNQEGRVSEDSI